MYSLDSLVVFVFGLSILFIGLWKVSWTEFSYLVADRKTGFFALTATIVMTEFNTATVVGFCSLGYLAGFWGLILPFIFLIGLLFYAFSVAKKWKAFNGLSVAAFFSQRYGKDIGRFASVTLLISTACFCAAYVKSFSGHFSAIFSEYFGMDRQRDFHLPCFFTYYSRRIAFRYLYRYSEFCGYVCLLSGYGLFFLEGSQN